MGARKRLKIPGWIYERHLVEMPNGDLIEHDVIWTTERRWATLPQSTAPGWFMLRPFWPFVLAFRITA
jgi:hypothetical protein